MGLNPHDLESGKGFLDMTIKATNNKRKGIKIRLHQNDKSLCFKGHHQEKWKSKPIK